MRHPTSKILLETREKLGVNKSEMARRLDIASQLYGRYEKGEIEPKLDFKQKFFQTFGINLIDDEQNVSYLGIPLIPIDAMAGFGEGEMQIMEYETEKFVVPAFKGADFLIGVRGSSMYPKYNSGDIVACKKLTLQDVFFQWNKVYVLDTDQGALIKRVQPGSDDKHILIVSDNEKYKPFELHREKLNAIALVIGVIRLE